MKKPTKRRPRARWKRAGDRTLHVYRVLVEQTRSQTVIVEAENPGQAERLARNVSWLAYGESEPVAAVQAVEMTDGTWNPCNAPEGK